MDVPNIVAPRSYWLTETINYKHFALGFASELIINFVVVDKKKDMFDITAGCIKYGCDTQAC